MAKRFRGFLEQYLNSHQSQAATEAATDTELLRRFVSTRDQQAFELLVWRHGLMVLGVCTRLIRDEHHIEDAFQAVFLVLARKARAIRGSNVSGWLFRVARRIGMKLASKPILESGVPDIGIEASKSSTEREELANLLDAEIACLPQRLRQPVLLCYLGGRSTEEAARELGCPRGTILSRLSAARKLLSDRLRRRGVTLPAALPLVGLVLEEQLVSATASAANNFLAKTLPLNSVSLLAEGVLKTMTHHKQIAILSAIVLVAGLIGGVGWVHAGGESGNRVDRDLVSHTASKQRSEQIAPGPDRSLVPKADELGFVRLAQAAPTPNELEEIDKLLKLDPVIANAMKPNANDSPLRKLQKAACYELARYMFRVLTLVELGRWNPADFSQTITMAVSFPRSILELMDKPTDKLKCYELEVRLLKAFEDFTVTRVAVGTDPSQNENVVKAVRLEAEIKLLKFKQEIEKAGK